MLPRVYREFEAICSRRGAGGSVLEIGAVPNQDSLLCMDALRHATQKIGLNLDGPHRYRDFQILRGDANAMTAFEDHSFDTVLCHAVLEHDPYFWRAVSEIYRVTRPGGLIVIGAPGYVRLPLEGLKRYLRPLGRSLGSAVGRQRLRSVLLDGTLLLRSTLTVEVHRAPGDYYRFSRQAFAEVILGGLEDVEVRSLLVPPILVGAGTKPAATPRPAS